jgi:hypothetical protein
VVHKWRNQAKQHGVNPVSKAFFFIILFLDLNNNGIIHLKGYKPPTKELLLSTKICTPQQLK